MLPHGRLSPAAHAISAFAVFIGIVGLANGPLEGSLVRDLAPSRSIDIGVEHENPASMRLDMTTLEGTGITEITNESPETLRISLPSTWTRREVRNVALSDVTSDPPSFGYMRWHIPAGGLVSFKMFTAPDRIVMHNPSGFPLKVRFANVNLETQEVVRDVILVNESPTPLW